MRFNEFIVEETTAPTNFYAVGDSTAYNLAIMGGPWKSFGKPGATSADATHTDALNKIPKGSIVAIALGADETVSSQETPEHIAGRINVIVQYAQSKGLQPVFVLFPAMQGESARRSNEVRYAIFTTVKVPLLDMMANGKSVEFQTIAAQIMNKFSPEATTTNVAPGGKVAPATGLNFESGVDPRINPMLAQKLIKIFSEYGQSLPIHSGYRDPARNKRAGGAKNSAHMRHNAVDVNTASLSKAERLKLIKIASANGIGGIGVYANNLHFDIERRRAWGPSYSYGSMPSWAKATIDAHLSGQLSQSSKYA